MIVVAINAASHGGFHAHGLRSLSRLLRTNPWIVALLRLALGILLMRLRSAASAVTAPAG
jgi:hypothetical protein